MEAAGADRAGDPGRLESRLDSTPPDLLAALVDSVADGLYLVDDAGRVRFVNPAGLALLGYDDERELLGAASHATIHGVRPDGTPFPEDACPLLRPRRTGEVVHVEDDWFVRRDGTFVNVAYSSSPVAASGGGRGAVVVFRDVSARREAERERERAAQAAAKADALQASRARIVAAADAERVRLGRDLHDGAQQRLVHVALSTQLALGRLAAQDDAGARALLTDALAEARTAIDELRDLAAGIHPSVLTNRGLRAAVEALTAHAPVPTAFSVVDGRFPPAVEAAAYFVVAEALTNIAKHAQATRAEVTVTRDADGEALVVAVADDGRGGAALGAGSGLRGLEDRVGALGGTLAVQSVPGEGTRVRARLPLDPAA
jgi:PAS domain S-box-containing protein